MNKFNQVFNRQMEKEQIKERIEALKEGEEFMYDETSTNDLIATAHAAAHPSNNPSAEHASLIDELAARLARLSVWRERMMAAVTPHLIEDDGSDLIPDHVRVSNMLERISSPNNENTKN